MAKHRREDQMALSSAPKWDISGVKTIGRHCKESESCREDAASKLMGPSPPSSISGLSSFASIDDASETDSGTAAASAVPCFGDYLACSFLGISIDQRPCTGKASDVYHSLVKLGDCYLLKNMTMLHECINNLGLQSAVRLYEKTVATEKARAVNFQRMCSMPFSSLKLDSSRVGRQTPSSTSQSSSPLAAISRTEESNAPLKTAISEYARSCKDMEARHSQAMVRRMVVDIMKELEVCAFEYFSYNWNHVDEVVKVNQQAMRLLQLSRAEPQPAPEHLKKLPSCPHLSQLVHEKLEETNTSAINVSEDHLQRNVNAASSPSSPSRDVHLLSNAPFRGPRQPLTEEQSCRARANWLRGRCAAKNKITLDMLGVTRKSKTLKEVFESLKKNRAVKQDNAIMQSSLSATVHLDPNRQPVLLLLAGGMAAGKSTVRELIGKSDFWSQVAPDAVVVEADALKNHEFLKKGRMTKDRHKALDDDPVFRKLVHEYSTQAAEAILVAAINEQKDVIFDGTMSWAPFVEQTIAMARDHNRAYVCGPGYKPATDEHPGVERYWDPLPLDEQQRFLASHPKRRPYRIELVGVTCDPGLAVCRGLWRHLTSGRGVPIPGQLRSHRMFASSFERYTTLVDSATLYFTGAALTSFNKGHMDTTPQIIAHCSSATRGELLTLNEAYAAFKRLQHLNDNAESRDCLYKDTGCFLEGAPENKHRKTTPVSSASRTRGLIAAFQFLESNKGVTSNTSPANDDCDYATISRSTGPNFFRQHLAPFRQSESQKYISMRTRSNSPPKTPKGSCASLGEDSMCSSSSQPTSPRV